MARCCPAGRFAALQSPALREDHPAFGRRGNQSVAAYQRLRGLEGGNRPLCRNSRAGMQGFNIDVNSIAPGSLNTRLLDELLAAGPDNVGQEFHARMVRQQEEGGTPMTHAAELAVFLGCRERRHHRQADQRRMGSLEDAARSSGRIARHRYLRFAASSPAIAA